MLQKVQQIPFDQPKTWMTPWWNFGASLDNLLASTHRQVLLLLDVILVHVGGYKDWIVASAHLLRMCNTCMSALWEFLDPVPAGKQLDASVAHHQTRHTIKYILFFFNLSNHVPAIRPRKVNCWFLIKPRM